jgi:hypothetical protein
MEQVTPDAAARALADNISNALWVVPESIEMDDGAFNAYPVWSDERIEGERYRPKGLFRPTDSGVLHAGPDGVMWVTPDGHPFTVRFQDCEAVLRWDEGKHVLCGADGIEIEFDPTRLRKGDELRRLIAEKVPEELFVGMPAA